VPSSACIVALLLSACGAGRPDDGEEVGGGACTFGLAAAPEEVGMSTNKLRLAVDTARRWVDSERIVGGGLLVARRGKIVVHEAFGWSDRERGIPMQTDTIFDIGSDTKPVTGVAALMLYEERRLDLDDPVSRHLASWDNDRSRDITVYQLLTHTAGLPPSLDLDSSLAETVDQIGAEGPELPPGTAYQYSNRGTNSLGRLAEVISGVGAERLLAERIIAPLGLPDTFGVLEANDPRRSRVAAKYTGGAGNWSKSWDNTESSSPIFAPAYGLHSTVLDYGCFLEAMRRGGERRGVRLLEAETVRLATRPHSDYVYSPGEREDVYSYYGLHWFVTITDYDPANWNDKAHMFGHGGGWGTTAWVDRLHDLVFVYFTQSRDSGTLIDLRDLVHDAQVD